MYIIRICIIIVYFLDDIGCYAMPTLIYIYGKYIQLREGFVCMLNQSDRYRCNCDVYNYEL